MPIVINREEKVTEICEKAFIEFTEYGIDNFSLNQFIANHQLSKGQFYHYFKTKDDLIFEVMSQKTVEMMENLDLFISSTDSLREKLYKFFYVYIDDSEETVRYRRMIFDTFHLYTHSNDPKVKEFNKALYEWIDEKLVAFFVQECQNEAAAQILKNLSATADGMYIRSLCVEEYDLKAELSRHILEVEKMLTFFLDR